MLHKHIKSNHQGKVYMVYKTSNKVYLSSVYQNKQSKITLEFPEQLDTKAEQEFIDKLKNIYLKKIENGTMQEEYSALSFLH